MSSDPAKIVKVECGKMLKVRYEVADTLSWPPSPLRNEKFLEILEVAHTLPNDNRLNDKKLS